MLTSMVINVFPPLQALPIVAGDFIFPLWIDDITIAFDLAAFNDLDLERRRKWIPKWIPE